MALCSRAALPQFTTDRRRYSLRLPDGRSLDLGRHTLLMGILNVTPDSFADGGRYLDPDRAAEMAASLEADGADIIDIGGESTRPGADPVSEEDELARVIPVLDKVVSQVSIPVSVDTYKGAVAQHAIDHGASIVNDISALGYDPRLVDVLVATDVPIILMHNRGRPREMYHDAHYENTPGEISGELARVVERATDAGVSPEQIIVDPGLGFAKQAAHSFRALASVTALRELDHPILVGPSRKSFLTRVLGERLPSDREWGTAAAVTAAVLGGAHIVRVHGVGAMADVVKVADELVASSEPMS